MVDDWAIVVGVRRYPGISNLDGPENDAHDFHAWLIDPNGGDVPGEGDPRVSESHVRLILSSDFPDPADASSAAPTHAEVEKAFEWLDDIAEENRLEGKGRRVGRRLYVYFSGHGYAPSKDDAALLMANATPRRVGNHIAGRAWAEWFHDSGYFEEVALFMDCCRDSYTTVAMRPPHLPKVLDTNNLPNRKRFYAFGTQWDRKAWEKVPPGDNKPHGIFTMALLCGLRDGLAADPSTGLITAGSLRSYLYHNMRNFLTSTEQENPDIGKEPYIDDLTSPADPMLFRKVAPAQIQEFTVRLHIPAASIGMRADVFGDDDSTAVESIDHVPAVWEVGLKKGLYEARLAEGTTKPFRVKATTEIQDEDL